MAAMVFDDAALDLRAFAAHAVAKLPAYAVPLFVRQLPTMAVTGTMKHEKAKLRKQGMDPAHVADKIWYLDRASRTYERLTATNYHQIISQARL